MSDLSVWLKAQGLADLARIANRSPEEMGRVIVTDNMKAAAMGYFQSLYDPLISPDFMEEIFRIMAVLQPKAPAMTATPLSLL